MISIKDKQFESLVKSFYQQLFRYAYWLSKSRSIAEDLVQETFTRAWKNIHQLKDFNSAKPWLFTILSRENARRFERKQLPLVELNEEWQLEQIADGRDDLQSMFLRRAIYKLPDQYRQPLSLQIIGGLSTNEIADVMEVNLNTVSTRLFRARAELKKLMVDNSQERGSNNG
ncbi:sigma-70 family RNA polymerase sigma factor [Aliikangiella marina]|uniref:Sigma-70 family RNA polymerase sigma factor n=1 Tax=Aliikangiella marina TaxID=1712262 RepID=A0A545TA71_9GAMM|nr:sigma-70 family RNA polymerase sigma factor [Aliikangiella marina]TQV74113.1 sigma-70 family RNA polymerase sigma factor [Aliikangiella marina]